MTNSTSTGRIFNVYDAHDNFIGRATGEAEADARTPKGGHARDAISGRKVVTPAFTLELEETLIDLQADEARFLTVPTAQRGPIWKREVRRIRARIASIKRDLGR